MVPTHPIYPPFPPTPSASEDQKNLRSEPPTQASPKLLAWGLSQPTAVGARPQVGGVKVVYEQPANGSKPTQYTTLIFPCQIYESLKRSLERQDYPAQAGKSMWDFYQQWYQPFGELLTEMEERGIFVDRQQLEEQLEMAEKDITQKDQAFRTWVHELYTRLWGRDFAESSRVRFLNIHSAAQRRHLFFAPIAQRARKGRPKDECEQLLEIDAFKVC